VREFSFIGNPVEIGVNMRDAAWNDGHIRILVTDFRFYGHGAKMRD